MIIQCDAKSLEVVCGAYLSQDKVMMEELTAGLDMHSLNQKALGLPEGPLGRLIAKIFIFRLMYGGSAYSYANDSDFIAVSKSEKFWQERIDAFYNKYKGFYNWHTRILQDAMRDGHLIMPTGRRYNFSLYRDYKGELQVPQTIIKNYPVQGLGADIMAIARVSFYRRFKNSNIKGVLINTVHDSIVGDVGGREGASGFNSICHSVFNDLPTNFQRTFGVEFNIPLRCEVLVGDNMMEMKEYK
jgi:DNA polymerase I-like protein with 3'-5' exonuclease and polymerase domains